MTETQKLPGQDATDSDQGFGWPLLDWFAKLDATQKAIAIGGLGVGFFFLCCGCGGLLGMIGFAVSQKVNQEIAAADELWDSGKQQQAVSGYKAVIDENDIFIDDARPYGRIHAPSIGISPALRDALREASTADVWPTLNSLVDFFGKS